MKRSAFTLVELLVVIVIIGLLAAILITAVGAAREAARRGQCLTRQRDLAMAMITYATENNGLPGSLNQQGTTPIHSWAVAVFPMIGENKRYEVLMRNSSANNEVTQAIAPLPALICPSDNPSENAQLNYIVNCGPAATITGINGDNALPFILFRDRRAALTGINEKVKIEDIPSGASSTILLTERRTEDTWQGVWHANWTPSNFAPDELQLPNSTTFTRSGNAVANLGFVWARNSNFLPNSSANEPRPSSKHPGTIIAAYADGSARPINDDISTEEWLKAVCPDYEELVRGTSNN